MSISFNNLKDLVLTNTQNSDEVTIISGYYSNSMLEELAMTHKNITFYYGMYMNSGYTITQKTEFDRLTNCYPNLTIKIPTIHYVHTKCYIFKRNGAISNALVGSANCSIPGLNNANAELLTDAVYPGDIAEIERYANYVDSISGLYTNAPIKATVSRARRRTRTVQNNMPTSWQHYTGNPFLANLPLYTKENNVPVVKEKTGLNWGLANNHHSQTQYAEACIGISKFEVEHYPNLIPCQGSIGSGTGGRNTRRQDPIEVLWDDGTVMEMLFQGTGVQRPTPQNQTPQSIVLLYPKQLTAASGGVELGEYLRRRMNIGPRDLITYQDLLNYGRDNITFSLNNAGYYEADFHV